MTEETTPTENPKVKTGFAVLITEDGGVFIERNPQALSIPIEREATLVEVRRCVSEVLMDLQAQAAAEYTVIRLAQAQKPKADEVKEAE